MWSYVCVNYNVTKLCRVWQYIYIANMHLFGKCGLRPRLQLTRSILNFLNMFVSYLHVINFSKNNFSGFFSFHFSFFSLIFPWKEFQLDQNWLFTACFFFETATVVCHILHSHYHNLKFPYLFSVWISLLF